MTKLDSNSRSLIMPAAASSEFQAACRLIVLVPDLQVDFPAATRRIWELANAMSARVHFLGLYSDEAQEPGLRRELVTLSAMVSDARVSADAEVVSGSDWVGVLKSRLHSDDRVVCFAEKRVGLLGRPLGQILQAHLDIPLYILSGLYPRRRVSFGPLSEAISWAGSLAIIVAFFWLQVKLGMVSNDWVYTGLLYVSIPVEVGLIWLLNSLTG